MQAASGNKKILITGASGVLGQEIITRIKPENQILATHKTPLHSQGQPNQSQQITLDIRQPDLGLIRENYHQLSSSISDIIHCAAITDITQSQKDIFATNIDGVDHMVALAQASGAKLHYVSTAFCASSVNKSHLPNNAHHDCAYIESKTKAEQHIRQSDIAWTIIRPSIIIGHSLSGAIASFQGLHFFITSMLQGRLPIIPLNKSARCDFVPVDYVADAITKIITRPQTGKTYWLTSGQNALSVEEMIKCGHPFALSHGRDLNDLNIIDWEEAQNNHLPALSQRLPKGLRQRLFQLMELAQIIAQNNIFPSDFNTLLGTTMEKPFLTSVLEANIHYWGAKNNHHYTDIVTPTQSLPAQAVSN